MNSILVTQNDLNKFQKLDLKNHFESDVYVYNNRLYKILNPSDNYIKREHNVEKMSELSHPHCVFPSNKLVNEQFKFIGVEEEYLSDYTTLSKYLNRHIISYDKRLLLVDELCKTGDFFNSVDLSYLDFHSGNVLINNDDFKIIDLDSAEFYNFNSSVFEYIRKDMISKNLTTLAFQIMLNYNLNIYAIDRDNVDKLLYISNKKQKEVVAKVFGNSDLIDIRDYIDYLDEDYMQTVRRTLKIRDGKNRINR